MILIIGLGSMGKRRIRCLQALGYSDIVGFDPREDRRKEAEEKYGIKTTNDIVVADDTVFICTPPNLHRYYSDTLAGKKMFIEAGTELLAHGTPSITMYFNPLVQEIKQRLPEIGNLVNFTYHCGQYLPDWHPYEKVSDFYVSEAGAKEMVAFELMWIAKVLGEIESGYSFVRDDSYIEGLKGPDSVAMILKLKNEVCASIMIDVVARKPVRQLIINGTEGSLLYDLNAGVSEDMYVKEVKAFMDGDYPNDLKHSNRVIELTKELCE